MINIKNWEEFKSNIYWIDNASSTVMTAVYVSDSKAKLEHPQGAELREGYECGFPKLYQVITEGFDPRVVLLLPNGELREASRLASVVDTKVFLDYFEAVKVILESTHWSRNYETASLEKFTKYVMILSQKLAPSVGLDMVALPGGINLKK